MATDIVMPPLSQTSDTLILAAWLKKVGDPVAKGEALFEVETDKATLTVESPASGTLHEILVEPGTEVAAKARIGSIAAEKIEPVAAAEATPAGIRQEPSRAGNHRLRPAHSAAKTDRILASPRARRLADDQGLTLSGITATGPRGMIVERDVRAYLASAAASAADVAAPRAEMAEAPATAARRMPLSATRKTIARRLQSSLQTTTPVTLTRDTDATELHLVADQHPIDLVERRGETVAPAGRLARPFAAAVEVDEYQHQGCDRQQARENFLGVFFHGMT
jgi:pyruvate dehydrogenase E2 component (dihydrolipoamide acetyltransferase)